MRDNGLVEVSENMEVWLYLVFHGDRVPGHVDALDWAERRESLPDGVLAELVIDGAHIDAAHDGESSLPLCCHLVSCRGETERENAGC